MLNQANNYIIYLYEEKKSEQPKCTLTSIEKRTIYTRVPGLSIHGLYTKGERG